MKRLIMFILISHNLFAMQKRRLRRAYSIHPRIEELKLALINNNNNDPIVLEQCLDKGLPFALDRQYALLGLRMTKATRNQLLGAIEEFWYANIVGAPGSHLSSLFFDLNTLDHSYGLPDLNYAFKKMLTRLKQRLLTHLQDTEYIEQLKKIPVYEALPRLQRALTVASSDVGIEGIFKEGSGVIRQRIYVDPPLIKPEVVLQKEHC
jgi:hypothetical protein